MEDAGLLGTNDHSRPDLQVHTPIAPAITTCLFSCRETDGAGVKMQWGCVLRVVRYDTMVWRLGTGREKLVEAGLVRTY